MGIKYGCKTLADNIIEEVSNKVSGAYLKLVIIRVGDDSASKVYVGNKQKACERAGIKSEVIVLSETTSTGELISLIEKLNKETLVFGILVQLPLPEHIDESKIVKAIHPSKDVDGFHSDNVVKLINGEDCMKPCTAEGIIEIIKDMGEIIEGKHCVVVGRSNIVGKPVANLLINENATVTLCHSRTKNLSDFTKSADILIVAVGKRGLITGDMVKEDSIIIDVGMNRNDEGKLCGDVDIDSVLDKCKFVTPVPGGVGLMTVAMLLKNVSKRVAWRVPCGK